MKYLKIFNLFENNEEEEYKLFKDTIERIDSIPEDVNLIEYIKSSLLSKGGEYFYEDDNDKLCKIDFDFEGDDILIYQDGKYRLIPNEVIKPGDIYFDIRYPNEISKKSQHSPDLHPPFGYKQWVSNNKGNRWLDGNDAFILVEKI